MAKRRPKCEITPHALARFQERINPAGNAAHIRRLVHESDRVDQAEHGNGRQVRTVSGMMYLVHQARRILFVCKPLAHGRFRVTTCYLLGEGNEAEMAKENT
jgi:hypothetical protein